MKIRMSVVITLLAGAALYAQMGPPRGGPGFGPGPGGFGLHGGKVVTNLPFSADVNWSRTQTLLDGNTIQHTGSGKLARDVQGRTYNSATFSGGPLGQNAPFTRISIFDPVAGFAYELDPATKTAVRRAIKQRPTDGPWTAAPQANALRPTPPDVVKSDMGTSLVNGVSALGTKTTRTIPAGSIGNAQPIVSSTETWKSSTLNIVVSSKHVDPQSGQSAYNLSNIQATAPDASLFQVPADYKITDAHMGGHREMPPPTSAPQE